MSNVKEVEIVYTNYKGKTATRRIIPERMYYGKTEYHPEEQWLLVAHDVEKKAQRTFAVCDIDNWARLVTPSVTVEQEFTEAPAVDPDVSLKDMITGPKDTDES